MSLIRIAISTFDHLMGGIPGISHTMLCLREYASEFSNSLAHSRNAPIFARIIIEFTLSSKVGRANPITGY